jgi:hypothetical protein
LILTPSNTSPRDALQAKLIDRLEAGFQCGVSPQTRLAELRNSTYLAILVMTHCRLPHHAAADAIASSITVADLAARVSDLLELPNSQLF